MIVKLKWGKMSDLYGKSVLLFGAGSLGVRALEEMAKAGAHVVGFVDNDRSRCGEKVKGYTIYSPKDIIDFSDTKVIITSTYVEEITEQLLEMGNIDFDVICLGALRDKMPEEEFFCTFLSKEEGNDVLYQSLISDSPFFAGRLGSNELECMAEYYYLLHRDSGKEEPYHDNLKLVMKQGAGFFPTNDISLDRMVELYTEDLKQMDFVWSMWLSYFENLLYKRFASNAAFALYDNSAFPYDIKNPWTKALEGKKILVVHPFEKSIQQNYEIREKLHINKELLPEFQLRTMKSIQSIADEIPQYGTWFEALETMKGQIDQINFDIALIGAGAYGLPLGAYCKHIGKKAVHVGGMLQLFFGIRGRAWDKLGIYNENWTSPMKEEHPKGYKSVEAGRYW